MKPDEEGQIRLVLASIKGAASRDGSDMPILVRLCREDADRAMNTILERRIDQVKTPAEIDVEFERIMDSAVQAQQISAEGKGSLMDEFRQECFALSPTMEVEVAGEKNRPIHVQILNKEGSDVVFESKLSSTKTPAELETEVRNFLQDAVQAEKIPEGIEGDLIAQFRQTYFMLFHS
jgi:hypothetical protein